MDTRGHVTGVVARTGVRRREASGAARTIVAEMTGSFPITIEVRR